jgi:hypothetical protein
MYDSNSGSALLPYLRTVPRLSGRLRLRGTRYQTAEAKTLILNWHGTGSRISLVESLMCNSSRLTRAISDFVDCGK